MKIIIGITGASGAIYAQSLINSINELKSQVEDCNVIFTENAIDVWEYELQNKSWENLPFKRYDNNNFFAPMASGSSNYDLMIICPCSMGTLGKIAGGIADNLVTRSADMMLKERKKLILVTREMPLSLIHINNMKIITEAGGVICPASPSFYSRPKEINQIVQTVIEKVMMNAGLKFDNYKWGDKGQ